MRYLAATALSALMAAVFATGAAGQATWKLEQPPPPPGASFAVPLGQPGDLQFLAPNHGLLAVAGNATVPAGLYFYDGVQWRQLSTVCGGPARTSRIAIASAREFWTITVPSKPRQQTEGTALCHFRDGLVVASYSTPLQSPDPFREMTAAACNGPSDCWFGGIGAEDATGERRGAFHLHWDGGSLETVYAPQGRGVSDLETFKNGTIYETARIAKFPGDRSADLDLLEPEPLPRLIHLIENDVFANDPFTVAPQDGVPDDGTELLALDSDGEQIWAAGGGATSGPSVPQTGIVPRVPIAAFLDGTAWREVSFPKPSFSTTDRFVDVAAVPGTTSAWAAVQRFEEANQNGALARVARLDRDGTASVTTLPASGPGRGSADKIAFSAPNEGWMVTNAGWLFHYTDGTAYPRNTDPAFASTITFRPNEAAEQFIPDAPPVDDSELFKPPPVEIEQPAAARRHAAPSRAAAQGPQPGEGPPARRVVHAHAQGARAAARAAQGPHGCAHEGTRARSRPPPPRAEARPAALAAASELPRQGARRAAPGSVRAATRATRCPRTATPSRRGFARGEEGERRAPAAPGARGAPADRGRGCGPRRDGRSRRRRGRRAAGARRRRPGGAADGRRRAGGRGRGLGLAAPAARGGTSRGRRQAARVRARPGGAAARVRALHACDGLALRADAARRPGKPVARADPEPALRAGDGDRRWIARRP